MEKPQIITPKILQEIFIEEQRKFDKEPPHVCKKDFSNFIKKTVFSILGRKTKWVAPKEKLDGRKIKKILIFRFDRIGDYIVSTGIVRWLKAAMPDAQIDFISSNMNESIIKGDPNVNHVYSLKHVSGYNFSWFKSLWAWRNMGYDLIIALPFAKNTKVAIMATVIARNAEKILPIDVPRQEIYGLVFERQSNFSRPGRSWAGKMSSCAWMHINPMEQTNESDKDPYIYIKRSNFDVVRQIVISDGLKFKPICDNLKLLDSLSESDLRFEGAEYCVINFVGFEPDRQWDELQCADYAKRLIVKYPNLIIYITGIKSEEKRVDMVVGAVNSDKCKKILLTLQDFNLFLAGAKFLVSVDTSLVHIGATAKVPLVGLFHKNKYKLWFPHKSPFAIAVSPTLETINAIDNDTLMEATELLLNDIAPNYKAEDYSF